MTSEEPNQGENFTGNEKEQTPERFEQNNSENVIDYDRPIVCILEDENNDNGDMVSKTGSQEQQGRNRCRMFRVIRYKGKALASGGFGVTVVTNDENDEVEESDDDDGDESGEDSEDKHPDKKNDNQNMIVSTTQRSQTTQSAEYLFVEEVLFLHEKGLLRALLSSKDTLDTSQLYQLLPKLGISLASYRVYSHLRSQAFRVLRHDVDRYEILCLQNENAEQRKLLKNANEQQEQGTRTTRTNLRRQFLKLRRRVRESIKSAPPPTCGNSSISICWDAYNPNSNFGKTHPGLPDFYVAATYYNVPMVSFSELNALMDKCHGIPLKVATVSDSGTVVMFGVTDYGIPSLNKKTESPT